jgi:hypothetical protein
MFNYSALLGYSYCLHPCLTLVSKDCRRVVGIFQATEELRCTGLKLRSINILDGCRGDRPWFDSSEIAQVALILSVGGAGKMKELDRRLNRGYVSQSVARLGLLVVSPRQVDTTWVCQLQE